MIMFCSMLCSGVLGIKVKIMLPHDETGKSGPKKPLPDQVSLWVTISIHSHPVYNCYRYHKIWSCVNVVL